MLQCVAEMCSKRCHVVFSASVGTSWEVSPSAATGGDLRVRGAHSGGRKNYECSPYLSRTEARVSLENIFRSLLGVALKAFQYKQTTNHCISEKVVPGARNNISRTAYCKDMKSVLLKLMCRAPVLNRLLLRAPERL